MNTVHTTRAIEDYLNDFAGRPDMAGYDETKRIKIAEENRDFVWESEMWKKLIVSILTGFPIPMMVVCDDRLMDGGNRSTVLMKWMNNEFEVTIGNWTGNYAAMTPSLIARWNRCSIPMTIITNATPEERSQIYENYNSGKIMTAGQLLWNRKYLPLVSAAVDMIGRGNNFPLAGVMHQVWKRNWKKTKTLNELATAYSILVASMFGPDYFHTKFHVHIDRMLATREDEVDLTNLRFICEVLLGADPDSHVNPKKKEAVFKKFIGAMIYDVHNMPRDVFAEKWRAFCDIAYTTMTPEQEKVLVDVGVSRATNYSRIQCLSQNVTEFLNGNLNENPTGNDGDSTDSD
jgi:hypothetical protein